MKSDEEQGCNVNKHFQNTCDWASLRYCQTELWDRKYHCIPSHSKINKEVPYNSVWNSRISQIPSAFRFHTYKQPESHIFYEEIRVTCKDVAIAKAVQQMIRVCTSHGSNQYNVLNTHSFGCPKTKSI